MLSRRVMEDSISGIDRTPARTDRLAAWFLLLTATTSTVAAAQELRDARSQDCPPQAATNQSVSIDDKLALPDELGGSKVGVPPQEPGSTNPLGVEGVLSPASPGLREPHRLAPRGVRTGGSADIGFGPTQTRATPWYRTGLGALAVVLGLIGGVYVLARRWLPSVRVGGDDGVMRVVGRTVLSPRQSLVLVRVGRRFVVLGVSPERVDAVCEIADPEEVADLVSQANVKGLSGSAGFAAWLNREAADYMRRPREAESAALSGDEGLRAASKPLKELLNRLRAMQPK